MSLVSIQPKFVYPSSRQFPFDALGSRIINELELRYWKVPGLTITVDIYGTGKEKFQKISDIEGKDFLLHFDYEGLRHIIIPYIDLSVYSDESGPSLRYYVGHNMEKDSQWWKHGLKVNSKLHGDPKKYLRYEGYGYKNKRSEYLNHTTDLDREYDRELSEPDRLKVDDIFEEINDYLQTILDYILQYPELNYDEVPPLEAKKEVKYNGIFSKVYAPIDYRMKAHILEYQNGGSIEDSHFYAVGPSRRLCALSIIGGGTDFNEVCYDGFVWADPNITNKNIKSSDDLLVNVAESQSTLGFEENSVAVIKILYSNDVYVVDDAEFEKTRQEFFKHTDRLTDDELNQCYVARAKTLVPIDKYTGGYDCPIVLFNREVEFDEIESIISVDDDYTNMEDILKPDTTPGKIRVKKTLAELG